MMDCEQYDANVFEVIDLINRDYPRGGIARPGFTAGTCLRKDFAFSEERSNAPGMLLAVSRVNESVPRFLVEGLKRRLGGSLRGRKVAVLGLAFKADTDDVRDSLSHKLIRLLERELADVAVHDPMADTPTQPFQDADRGRGRGRRRDQSHRLLLGGGAAGGGGEHDRRRRARRSLGLLGHRSCVRPGGGRPGACRDRVSRVLVTGGAGTIGAAVVRRLLRDPSWEVRVSDQREAPTWMREGCEIHQGDLRDLDEARAATAGCSHVIHLAAIVGGIANFHKLPYTLTEVNNALYNAVVRAAIEHDLERFVYVSSSMVFEQATEYPTTEEHIWECPVPRSAYGFSKLTGEVYVRAADDEHGLPWTICRPVQRVRPRRDARGRARHRAHGPGRHPQGPVGAAPAPDLRQRASRPAPSRTSTTSRTGS